MKGTKITHLNHLVTYLRWCPISIHHSFGYTQNHPKERERYILPT